MENIIKVELIESFMTENKLSKTGFCKLCRIAPKTFYKIMTGDTNFGLIALFKIARVLKIRTAYLFDEKVLKK